MMYAQIDRVTTQRASMLLDKAENGKCMNYREWAYLLEWLKGANYDSRHKGAVMMEHTPNNDNKYNDISYETIVGIFGFISGFFIWFSIMVAILFTTDIIPPFYIVSIGGLVFGVIVSKIHIKIIRYRG